MEFVGLVALGLAVGVYGTLIGAGGGFVLVPILLMLYPSGPDNKPETLTAISLAMVVANAASGTVAYAHMKRIHLRAGIYFAVATLPGAVIGAEIVKHIPRQAFTLIMSAFLLVIAAVLIVRPRDRRGGSDGAADPSLHSRSGWPVFPFNVPLGVAISFGVGFVASMLGVGGGIVHVPAMVSFLHFPVHVATATSHFVLVFTALAGVLTHLADGTLKGADLLHRVLPLVIGVVPGSQVGTRLAKYVHGTLILRLLGAAMAIVAIRLLCSRSGL